MRRTLAVMLSLLFAGAALAATSQRQQRHPNRAVIGPAPRRTSRPASYSDRYAMLSDQNIFLRDRSKPNRPASAAQPSGPRNAEESLVLTGIVEEDGGYRAYVEDINGSSILKLSAGQKVAHGVIGEIQLDAVAYDHEGAQRLWIAIGNDFTGRASAALAAQVSSAYSVLSTTMPTTLPADLAGLNPNDPNLTTEQKMRLKRFLERGVK